MVGGAVKEASVRVRMLEAEGRSMDKLRGMEAERRREGIQEDDLVMRTLVAIIAGRGKLIKSSIFSVDWLTRSCFRCGGISADPP